MAVTHDHTELRGKFIAHIYEEEHSDLPCKTYRIISMEDSDAMLSITIKAKTRLGAVTAYADWDMENGTLSYKYWSEFAKEWNNRDIGEYTTGLVKKFFEGELPEGIKEVKEEIIISPFTGENTKSAGTC